MDARAGGWSREALHPPFGVWAVDFGDMIRLVSWNVAGQDLLGHLREGVSAPTLVGLSDGD